MSGRELRGETGSSSVLAVGLIGVLLTVTVAALAVLSAVRAAHVARSVADVAALAGAVEYQQVSDPQGACTEAARVAARHQVELVSCAVGGGGDVTVTVAARISLRLAGVGPERAEGRARAGPVAEE